LLIIKEKFDSAKRDNPYLPIPTFLNAQQLRDKFSNDVIVAVRNNHIIGFIGGFYLDDIDSHKHGFLTPLALHGVKHGENIRLIMFKLIQELSRRCITHGLYKLAILFHAYDAEMKHILHDLGYGGLTIDFIRGVNKLSVKPLENILIESVTVEDLKNMLPLFKGIQDHLMGSPIFLYDENPYDPIIGNYEYQLQQGGNGLFVAKKNDVPVGYIKYTINSTNRQELDGGKTIGINGAFIIDQFRGMGIMDHLLNQVIDYAIQHGYTHIMTDCETANFEAVSFWSKHFTPYSFGVLRIINDLV
jgi:GNAT superfamily N-acetyltransferase